MRSLHSRRAFRFALSASLLTGCLLTSDFDGITTGDATGPLQDARIVVPKDAPVTPPEADTSMPPLPDSSVDAAPDASADAAVWQPTPCTGRLECLPFDGALPTSATGWYTDQQGSGVVSYDPTSFAIGPGALRASVSMETEAGIANDAILYKTSTTDTASTQYLWGFDARLDACPGNALTQDAYTLSSLLPAAGTIYGLASSSDGDLLIVQPPLGSEPTNFALPALPRNQWLHLDFAVVMGQDTTTFRISMNGVELRSVTLAADTPSTSTLLNVGVLTKNPAGPCTVFFDNYYFDHVAP